MSTASAVEPDIVAYTVYINQTVGLTAYIDQGVDEVVYINQTVDFEVER